jgi:predicted nucleotidyltransferase
MEIQVEKLPEPLRRKGVEKKVLDICRRNDIIFMAIFGSFVRGEQTRRSDVDVAIEFEKGKKKSLLDLVHIQNELGKAFRRKVDLGTFRSLNPYVIEDVKKEMRVIYDQR